MTDRKPTDSAITMAIRNHDEVITKNRESCQDAIINRLVKRNKELERKIADSKKTNFWLNYFKS